MFEEGREVACRKLVEVDEVRGDPVPDLPFAKCSGVRSVAEVFHWRLLRRSFGSSCTRPAEFREK